MKENMGKKEGQDASDISENFDSEKRTILHVDDEIPFLNLFKLSLGKQFNIISAASGSEALEKLEENNEIEAIVTDYELPGFNGLELLRQVKKNYPRIPVIFYTGQGNERIAREAFLSGASDYFVKEIRGFAHKEKLINSIRGAIERTEAQEALRESEERYRKLVELSPDAIVIHREGKFVFANTAAVKLYGADSPDELIGKPVFKVIHPEYHEIVKKRIRTQLKGGESAPPIEEKIVRKDGEVISVEVTATPFTYRGKKAVQVVARDMTQRKKAVEKLIQSEEKYRTLLHNIQDGVFLIQDQIIIFANEAFAKIAGYEVDEIIGKNFRDLVAPEDLKMVADRYFKRVAGEDVVDKYEFKVLHKDGVTRKIVNMTVGTIDYKGKKASLGTVKDITETSLHLRYISHLNQVLTTIRKINQIIVQERHRESMLQSICRCLVETRGYLDPWIALQEDDKIMFYYCGATGSGKCEKIKEAAGDGKFPDCIKEFAKKNNLIIEKRPVYECASCYKWGGRGDSQKIVIQLKYEDKIYGYMGVSIPAEFTGVEEEKDLFKELANDVTFAIHHMEIEKQKEKALKELKKSEEKYRNLFEFAGDAIFLETLDGDIVSVNKKACELLGYTREELTNLSTLDIGPPNLKEIEAELISKLKKNETLQIETLNRRKDNTYIDVEVSLRLIRLGEEEFVLALVRDITEKVKARRKLLRVNKLLHTFYEIYPTLLTDKNAVRAAKEACKFITKLGNYKGAWIILTDKNGNPETFAESGIGEEFQSFHQKMKEGQNFSFIAKAAQKDEPVLVEDGEGLPDIESNCSYLVMKLANHDEMLGYMGIYAPTRLLEKEEERLFLYDLSVEIGCFLNCMKR